MKKALLTGLVLASFTVSACATPTVVDSQQPGDRDLSCMQLREGIQVANDYEQDARDERGLTGTNVVAFIFFWPALIATYLNTEEAITAAQERQQHLQDIYDSKGC